MTSKVDELPLWKAAVVAFVTMAISDLLATAMVIEEARLNAPVAGLLDVAGYLVSLACSVLAVGSILDHGWKNKRSLVIIGAISISNFVGTFAGVAIGSALTHHH